MLFRRAWMSALLLGIVLMGSVPSFAAESMVFKQPFDTTQIHSGDPTWVACASLRMVPPEDGYVVVTVSGMAYFYDIRSDLSLTLSKARASRGPWIFTLTPGYQPYQSYNVRYVFPVTMKQAVVFYLNARSGDGDGRIIGVQPGSMTAEFYPSSEAQKVSAPAATLQAAPEEDSPPDPNINPRTAH